MKLVSSVFCDGQAIPRRHTGDGDDISPPLSWSEVPPATMEFAVICDDPDAPAKEPWVHWLIYKIPAAARELPEGVLAVAHPESPPGAVQGFNSWKQGQTIGYRGPAPPAGHGVHRYRFFLFALDTPLNLSKAVDRRALTAAMTGHILAQAELMGTYQR